MAQQVGSSESQQKNPVSTAVYKGKVDQSCAHRCQHTSNKPKHVSASNRERKDQLQSKSKHKKTVPLVSKKIANAAPILSVEEKLESLKISEEKRNQEKANAGKQDNVDSEKKRPKVEYNTNDTTVDAPKKSKETQKKKQHLKEIMRYVRILDYKIGVFKDNFRTSTLFNWNCKNPYEKIDQTYKCLVYMEREEELLDKKVDLFKLHCPLKVVRKELKQAKKLWDLIGIIMPQLREWKNLTKNYGSVEYDCNKFKDDLRKLDNLKGCDAYDKFMETIDFMLGSVITVSEIRDQFLRDCLWQELMKKAKF